MNLILNALGLSVSRGWIRKMGGAIRVHSVLGEGTTLAVLLPTTEIPFGELTRQPPSSGTSAPAIGSSED